MDAMTGHGTDGAGVTSIATITSALGACATEGEASTR
jgi:hypothetical protein